MKIIKGKELELLLANCKFQLDAFIKQLGNKKYPPNSGKYMLILTTSNGSIWILEQELEIGWWFNKNKCFEFEGVSPDNEGDKIYILSKELISIIQNLTTKNVQFKINILADTIGLENYKFKS